MNKEEKMPKFLKILIYLSLFFFSLFPVSKVYAEDKYIDQELGVTYETSSKLYFSGFNNLFIEINIKRYFLEEVEYEFLIIGKISYDSDTEMFKLEIDRNLSKLNKAPYSRTPLSLTKQYGVLKLLNAADRENDFIISILSDNENNDPIFLAPSFKTLGIPVKMPEEAITDPTQNMLNFPGFIYKNELKEVYLPLFSFGNSSLIRENIKYEIVEQSGEIAEITAIFNSPLSPYKNPSIYRLVEDPINNQAKILKRVKFFDRNPNYFNNYNFALKVTELSGLTFTDSTNHQITISGSLKDTPTNVVFLATNNSPDLSADRPLSIFSFTSSKDKKNKIDYKSENPQKGPPLFISWEIFPKENVQIELKNPSGETVYQGFETTQEGIKIKDFKIGKYTLFLKNSLNSKMAELRINPPEAKIEINSLEIEEIDNFNQVEKEIPLNQVITFSEIAQTKKIVVYVSGNPTTNLFVSPYGHTENNAFLIREISREEIAPKFLDRYVYEIRQLKKENENSILVFSSGNLKQNIQIIPSQTIEFPQGIIKKSEFLSIFAEGSLPDKNDFFEEEKVNEDFLIFNPNLSENDFLKIEDEIKRNQLLSLWQKSLLENNNDPFLNQKNENNLNNKTANPFKASLFDPLSTKLAINSDLLSILFGLFIIVITIIVAYFSLKDQSKSKN